MEAKPERVVDFLRHSRLIDMEDTGPDQFDYNSLEQEDYVTPAEMYVPKQQWKDLRRMCEELGLLGDYNTMYRLTSQRIHGGAYSLPEEFPRLFGRDKTLDWEATIVLLTARLYYSWVVDINRAMFSDRMSAFANFQPGTDWANRLERLMYAADAHFDAIIKNRYHPADSSQ